MDDDYVSLTQAIKYVVFRNFEHHGAEEIFENEEKLNQASAILWKAVLEDYVSLYKKTCNNYVEATIMDFAIGEQYVVASEGFEQSDLDCGDMLFSKTELIDNFPSANYGGVRRNKKNTDEYTTSYLDIMHQVIDEENISNDNQGKKEALTAAFVTKMESCGLPPSKNLAKSMATLIRQVDSQKGKRKKL